MNHFSRELADAGGPVDRRNVCLEGIQWTNSAEASLSRKQDQIQHSFRQLWEAWNGVAAPGPLTPMPDYFQMRTSHRCRRAGVAALFADLILTAFVSLLYINLPALVAILVGEAFAICITFGAEGVATWLIRHAGTRPRRAERVVNTAIGAVCIVEVACLVLLFQVRTSSGHLALQLANNFSMVTGLLAVFTPILAGFLFAKADLFGWSGHHNSEQHETEMLKHEVVHFRDRCSSILADVDTAQEGKISRAA